MSNSWLRILALGALCVGATHAIDLNRPAKADSSPPAPPIPSPAISGPQIGRYQMMRINDYSSVMLDTATGKAWNTLRLTNEKGELQGTVWQPMLNIDLDRMRESGHAPALSK